MEQRFVFWGILSMVDRMVQTNRYWATTAEVFWRGSRVGAIRIQVAPLSSTKNSENIRLTKTLFEISATNVGADAVNLESLHFHGPPNSMGEVFIGAIAAVISAAKRFSANDNLLAFEGSWPNSSYSIFQLWWTKDRPSRFSKNALLTAIVAAIGYATSMNDYRSLRCIVTNHELYIGEGGWGKYSSRTRLSESSNAATS